MGCQSRTSSLRSLLRRLDEKVKRNEDPGYEGDGLQKSTVRISHMNKVRAHSTDITIICWCYLQHKSYSKMTKNRA